MDLNSEPDYSREKLSLQFLDMKISASIYSQKQKSLAETVQQLHDHGIDLFHIDCNDNPGVFEDIRAIRRQSNKPVDLHIISAHPEKYYPLLREFPVEYLTFQYENLVEPIAIPKDITGKKGLAFTSETPITAFTKYKDQFDFVLIMATTPGQSGGQFNQANFAKVRAFQKLFPDKKIHVDGGVNAEISFILRNMGVYSCVSGSYLFKSDYLGAAMLNLKGQNFDSRFTVGDIMIPAEECPILNEKSDLQAVLNGLDDYKLGFVMLGNEQGQLTGIISNADLRKGLIRNIQNLNGITVESLINTNPVKVDAGTSVKEMLLQIKAQKIPINYLPVTDKNNQIAGAITFFNLIKGEL